jgi:hypothetical protein
MRAKAASALLSILLTASLLWGNCALCPPSEQQPSPQHDCCKPATRSHCNPSPEESGKQKCPKHSLVAESYQKAKTEVTSVPEAGMAEPAPATPAALAPAKVAIVEEAGSPSDLYLLHSVLLI